MSEKEQMAFAFGELDEEPSPQMKLPLDAQPPSVHEQIHAFSTNVVLRAGAGTGKTEALTSLYVHLVAGATDLGRPVSPERIVAVTFTEKAAGEMRERIGGVLRWLAGRDAGGEPPRIAGVVAESLRARGRVADGSIYGRALSSLSGARITTLHSFCASLLRGAAPDAGIDPDFGVLEEDASRALLEEALVQSVRAALESPTEVSAPSQPSVSEWTLSDSEHRKAVSSLLRDLGGLRRPNGGGLLGVLTGLHSELSETGKPPAALVEGTPHAEAGYGRVLEEAGAELGLSRQQAAAGDFRGAWETLVGVHERLPEWPGLHAQTLRKCEQVAEVARGLREKPSFGLADDVALLEATKELAAACGSGKAAGLEDGARARAAVEELYAAPRCRARAQAIVRLLDDAGARYGALKRERQVLDFSDLTRKARDLLRDRPAFRRELSDGIDALLVDEFQDTNAVQRDLVYLLHAGPDVGARVPSPRQLLARGLFVVGDRKQSIYGFRNADVTVFEEVAEQLVSHGGRELSLMRSYRSTRPLVHVMNALAEGALVAREGLPFEIDFDARTEMLEAVFEGDQEGGPPVDYIAVGDPEDGPAESELVARHVLSMVAGASRVRVRGGDGRWRPAGPGDVALLLPRFTHVLAYLRALDDLGIPYVVVKGRGLMQTSEARDVLALARVLANEDDGRGVLAILRGPMVALSDGTLLRLSRAAGRRGFRHLVAAPPELGHGVSDDEVRRYSAAMDLLGRLRGVVDRIGLAACLKMAITETGYAAVCAALPGGTQRVANVDRILSEFFDRERAGEDGREVLHDLWARSEVDGDREADVATEDADAVRVMTVHQSKGLQFPIVVAADLGRRTDVMTSPVEYDRHPGAGLAVAVRDPREAWLYQAHHRLVHETRNLRERAERLRLFYVQMTRARDRLVLVGKSKGIWAEVVEPMLPALESMGSVTRREDTGASELPHSAAHAGLMTDGPTNDSPPLALGDLGLRARPAVPRVRVLEVPVTQLEDFALCPRRFRARHVLRLPEHPAPRTPPSVETDGDLSVDPRRRGTLAHAVLEKLDFGLAVEDPDTALARAMADAQAGEDPEITARLLPFVMGPHVERMARLDPSRVQRELPFALSVPAGGASLVVRGQIDLVSDDGESVEVLDYKVSSPRSDNPTEPYVFQLGTYALAVTRRLEAIGERRRVAAAVQFLDGKARLPLPVEEARGVISRRLPVLAEQLIEARQTQRFEGREVGYCTEVRCGYAWLCHGNGEPTP